jgi:uncharacterized protein (DUF952 family)
MIIYHLLAQTVWESLPLHAPYAADTLATEGFIHLTREPERLLLVANAFYRALPGDFVVLAVETERVTAEIRWEPADGHLFPHIYGALNRDAVQAVYPFPRAADGTFLPPILSDEV